MSTPTLQRTDAPFDRYVAALKAGDANAVDHIGDDAVVGLDLFVGRANCILCHSGPTLSDLQFHPKDLLQSNCMEVKIFF